MISSFFSRKTRILPEGCVFSPPLLDWKKKEWKKSLCGWRDSNGWWKEGSGHRPWHLIIRSLAPPLLHLSPFIRSPRWVSIKRWWRLPSAYFEASARWPNIGRVKNELGRIKQRNVQMIPVYFHVVVDFNLNRFHTLMTIIFSLSLPLSLAVCIEIISKI